MCSHSFRTEPDIDRYKINDSLAIHAYYTLNAYTEPEVLDFGSIVVDHVVEKCITLRNFSKKHVSIQFKVRMFLTVANLIKTNAHCNFQLYSVSRVSGVV